MKILFDCRRILFVLIAFFGLACTYAGSLDGRLIDDGWFFRLNPYGNVTEAAFDHSTWQAVDLPHDWSQAFDFTPEAASGNDGGYLPTGRGAYRKVLPPGTFAPGRRHRIYLEGAYMNSTVWVNGDSVGGHPYGYASYFLDITPYVNPDSATVIAISVDNSHQKNSRWFTGSGIYRHVWLSDAPLDAEIEPWSLRTVSSVPDKKGAVKVDVEFTVMNSLDSPVSRTAVVSVGSARVKLKIKVDAHSKTDVTIPLVVRDARLWSPESPALYDLTVDLTDNKGVILDSESARIGLRTIRWSGESGFMLNGEPMLINGACVHHDNGILGSASFDDAEIHKAQLLKRAGFNAVRTSHNHPAPAFLAACDSIGLLVIDEAFDGWEQAKTPHDYSELIGEWWQKDLDALVRRDRCHPSVIAWSIGNEILERKSKRAVELANRFADYCRSLDPQKRPVTQALAAWDSDWEIYDPLAAAHDIIGYNYMIHKVEGDHQRVPGRVVWQTESYPRDAFSNWTKVHDLPYVVGDFVWTGIDYIGESGIGRYYYEGQVPGEHFHRDLWPWHGSQCGDIDIIGQPKPISRYRDILHNVVADSVPEVYMAVREPDGYHGKVQETMWGTWPTFESWNWHGWEGQPIEVEVVSTLPEVVLQLDGQEIGRKKVGRDTEYKAVFRIEYHPGRLVAIGYDASGNAYKSNEIATAGAPAEIRLEVERPGSGSLAYVTATILDDNGRIVPDADLPVLFEPTGSARFLAAGSADMTDSTSYSRPLRTTHHGRALANLRLSADTHSESGIRVTTPTLPPASLTF